MTTATSKKPPTSRGGEGFTVRGRIGRATGEAGRYSCDRVRALPGPKRNQVVLEATDGHQATCVLAPGSMSSSKLVPPQVLPTRRTQQDVHVRLVDNQWQSSDGKHADEPAEEGRFPPIGDVLPVLGSRPFYETASQAERRRAAMADQTGKDTPESMHVMTGIDVAELSKIAEGLGTSKLTLYVPVPVRRRDDRKPPEQTCANRAIAVCPAERPDKGTVVAEGIGVIMPINLERTPADYMTVREAVLKAERRAAKRRERAG